MDKPTIINYQSRDVDLEQLKRVSAQGIDIDVSAHQLNPIHQDDHATLIVVAHGKHNYDVLAGTIVPDGKQKARLISKVILKKASGDRTVDFNTALPEQLHELQDRFRSPARNRYARSEIATPARRAA